MAKDNTVEELLAAIAANPTFETLEAAVNLLRSHRFTAISGPLFRLADAVREKLSAPRA